MFSSCYEASATVHQAQGHLILAPGAPLPGLGSSSDGPLGVEGSPQNLQKAFFGLGKVSTFQDFAPGNCPEKVDFGPFWRFPDPGRTRTGGLGARTGRDNLPRGIRVGLGELGGLLVPADRFPFGFFEFFDVRVPGFFRSPGAPEGGSPVPGQSAPTF